jgi:putative sterol carrier protein
MMQKKLELKGQMTTIVKYVNASKELVECATRVPTAFLDDK